jgi:hypothetical protein
MALGLMGLAATASGDALTPSGAIFTTTSDGTVVNGNIYDKCCDAYLNGGPQNKNDAGLPVGDYYFQVTIPGWHPDDGATGLLSTDPAGCRIVHVDVNSGGHGVLVGSVPASGCEHPTGTFNPANGSTPVALCPFDHTSNPGGEYKAWLIPVAAAVVQSDGITLLFSESDSKTDNFKCRESLACGTDPVCISCPEDITIPCTKVNDTCAKVEFAAPIVSPAGITAVCTPPSGSCFAAGTTTKVTCAASDANDPPFTATCSFNVTVGQCPSCELTCPVVAPVCNVAGSCGAQVTYLPPSCSESDVTVSCLPASGSAFPVGSTTVTCTATQNGDVVSSCQFSVVVNDCEKPVVTCPDPITTCNDAGVCTATVSFTATALDNCDGVITPTCSPASGSSFAVGQTTVTCSATDKAGKTGTCSFTVTVNDCEKPVVTCPGPITMTAGACSTVAKVTFTASALDNCDGVLTPTCSPASGTYFTVGQTKVTCSATDKAGNTGSCSFTVTVKETTSAACGGLTIGFWQNKNGGSILLKAAEPALANYLKGYCPFNDLAVTTPAGVSNYVYGVIKAANASGSSMNAMLKAQMLATTLNVYFSTTGLGGNQINAAKALGGLKLDLTMVCKTLDGSSGSGTCSSTYENTSGAFNGNVTGCGGAFTLASGSCVAVSELLADAAAASSSGGGLWYANNKATQGLAKDTFDAFNNGFTLLCP